ncbi:MAG: hypothetical protein JWO48_481, partial [Bryobacterales bacterium]|nr:hypothetical protein [Bryobacterales bacterium]
MSLGSTHHCNAVNWKCWSSVPRCCATILRSVCSSKGTVENLPCCAGSVPDPQAEQELLLAKAPVRYEREQIEHPIQRAGEETHPTPAYITGFSLALVARSAMGTDREVSLAKAPVRYGFRPRAFPVCATPGDFFLLPCVSMLDLKLGDVLTFEAPVAFLLQTNYLEMLQRNGPIEWAILGVLFCFSLYS